LENLLTGLTMPLFLPNSSQEGRVGKPFNWFEAWLNQLKGFPTLPYEVQVINTITSLQ
jgi:hypothetical protein